MSAEGKQNRGKIEGRKARQVERTVADPGTKKNVTETINGEATKTEGENQGRLETKPGRKKVKAKEMSCPQKKEKKTV